MAYVAFGKVEDYDEEKILSVIEKLFSLTGIDRNFKPGERILLKPNVLAPRKAEMGITTNPKFVSAAVKFLRTLGLEVIVSDSPGGAGTKSMFAMKETGIYDAAVNAGAKVVPIEKFGIKTFKSDGGAKIHISKIIDEVDGIVNLPKLKTHSLTLLTLAVKNCYGLVPGFMKARYHFYYPTPRKFSWLLAEIYERVRDKIRAVILDGIVAMEGNGPSAGDLRKLGLIGISDDCAAIDDALEKMLGQDKPSPVIKELKKRKLVPDYKVSWLNGKETKIHDFAIPSNWKMRLIPSFLGTLANRLIQIYPIVDESLCTGCGDCASSCPANAINISSNGLPKFDYKRCIRCLCCHEICPSKAIKLKRTFLTRFV